MGLRPLARSGPAHPSSAPARPRPRSLFAADTPRACALLLQVGSDRPRAPLSSTSDAPPRPQGPAASSVASTLPLSSFLSLGPPLSARCHGKEPDEALQATSVLPYRRSSGRVGSGGERGRASGGRRAGGGAARKGEAGACRPQERGGGSRHPAEPWSRGAAPRACALLPLQPSLLSRSSSTRAPTSASAPARGWPGWCSSRRRSRTWRAGTPCAASGRCCWTPAWR